MESTWKGVLDLIYDNQEQRIMGVNFQGGSTKIWSTDIKSINFTETHARKSLSIFKPRSIDKENNLDSANKKFGISNLERKKTPLRMVSHPKSIDINLQKLQQPSSQINQKFRSQTPKDSNFISRNNSQNQKSPLVNVRKSSECNSTPRIDQKKKDVRTMNLGHLKERGLNQRIDEVSAECETSIMNMQKFCNEELKLSSFFVENDTNSKIQQSETINSVKKSRIKLFYLN